MRRGTVTSSDSIAASLRGLFPVVDQQILLSQGLRSEQLMPIPTIESNMQLYVAIAAVVFLDNCTQIVQLCPQPPLIRSQVESVIDTIPTKKFRQTLC